MNYLDLEDRSKVERVICGALLSAINDHGVITKENRSSAAKRVYGQLKCLARGQKNARVSNR